MFFDQNCTYGEDREYLHQDGQKIPEGNKMEAMARKVVYLEEEIVTLKNAKKNNPNEPLKDTSKFTN